MPKFNVGDRVKDPQFGEGIITQIWEGVYTVRFSNRKTFIMPEAILTLIPPTPTNDTAAKN